MLIIYGNKGPIWSAIYSPLDLQVRHNQKPLFHKSIDWFNPFTSMPSVI